MEYEYWIYIIALLTSTALTAVVGSYLLLKSRNAKGTPCFLLMLLLISIWTLGTVLETVSVDFAAINFWVKVQYVCFCYLPVVLFVLSTKFTGHDRWASKRSIRILTVLPTIIMLLALTNDYHGLVRYNEYLDYTGAFPVIHKEYGFAFYVLITYAYVLSIAALLLFIHAGFIKKTISKIQVGFVLSGIGLIVVSSFLYSMGISLIKAYDITPALIGPSVIIITVGVFYHRLFELVPIARDAIIETMQSAILVLDMNSTVMDTNPAFNKMIGATSSAKYRQVEEVCNRIPDFLEACVNWKTDYREFSIEANGQTQVYEAFFSLLYEKNHIPVGRLAVIHEITEKKREEEEYFLQQRKLAVVEEKERMARDLHDDLGQVLGFINLQARGIQRELSMEGIGIASDKLDQLAAASQMAHGEIRKYIRNARKKANYEGDFLQDLKREVFVFEDVTGIPVEIDIRTDVMIERIPRDKQFHIFSILRESLNNIRNHARAKRVRISFAQSENRLGITVEDDGKGFELLLSHNNRKDRFGLAIMRERAQEIGANIEIKSATGKGTEVVLSFPLGEEQKNGE